MMPAAALREMSTLSGAAPQSVKTNRFVALGEAQDVARVCVTSWFGGTAAVPEVTTGRAACTR
jgi:hypothetical protein